MGWRWGALILSSVLIGLAGDAAAIEIVTGTASYRERMALPEAAVFVAVLEDVSRADAAATEVGRISIENPGGPPYDFAIEFDPTEIDARGVYAVRASVYSDGRLLFASDTHTPVITRGAPLDVNIEMRRVGPPAGETAGLLADLPAQYAGALPCPDCEALRYHLNLWPDMVFHLRRNWKGTDRVQDTIGRWRTDPSGRRLVLVSGGDRLEFEVPGEGRLRPLDLQGQPLAQGSEGELTVQAAPEPLDPHLPMRGMVAYLSDRAKVRECETGRDYDLAMEGDFATLEEAYLASGAAQGERIMASFEGTIVHTSDPEGGAPKAQVRVEAFTGIWPGEACEPSAPEAALTNTYWRLLRLGDVEIVATAGATEPHLTLDEVEGRYAATVGCNQLVGRFEAEGEELSFGQGATTMMACPPPLDDWERRLSEALAATTGWRIDGQALELHGADGAALGLFEAVYLR